MVFRTKQTRRQALQNGLAFTGSSLLALKGFGSALPSAGCQLTSELTEGPYYVPYELVRRDIKEGRSGLPLLLQIRLLDSRTCRPLTHAAVDVWHCDAMGVYSGFTKNSPDKMGFGGGMVITPDNAGHMPPPPPPGTGERPMPRPEQGTGSPPPGMPGDPHGRPPEARTTDKETFLRGVQMTDEHGIATFETIYPGWYVSRDVHVHLKVHLAGNTNPGKDFSGQAMPHYSGGHVVHTGQIAFSDELTDEVAKLAPYNTHKARRTRLAEDGVFRTQESIHESMLQTSYVHPDNLGLGLHGEITFSIDLHADPKSM